MSAEAIDLTDPAYYFNRELSWLRFDERVLEEAEDPTNPLLERLRFLAIFGSNLDEFMMIRYAGLKEQAEANVDQLTPDGRTPRQQLAEASAMIQALVTRHRQVLAEEVLPALAREGVRIRRVAELDESGRGAVEAFFESQAFPVLTPLAIDARHPFPRLPNLSFALLLEVVDRDDGASRFAVVQVPGVLPRFVRVPGGEHDFVLLEDVIRAFADRLFEGNHVRASYAFRVTRDADIEIAEDEAEDLLRAIEAGVRRRRWADAVRLEVEPGIPPAWRAWLQADLELEDHDVFDVPHHLVASDFHELAQLPIASLRFPAFQPRLPAGMRDRPSVFAAVAAGDVLVEFPYHDFDALQRMVDEAADDPDVLAIKMTLYRVGARSPVVAALARAAGNGKAVSATVELQARFDEEHNVGWARELERAGVHVSFGLPGMKTHCKALLVVRRETGEDGAPTVRRYVHVGTGNFNPATAIGYTDMGIFSCDEALAADVSDLFHYLTGYSKRVTWRKLWVAPTNLREKLLGAIDAEADHARAGRPSGIRAQMNSLVDPEVIRALYRASQAGVQIDLLVRGICCLRPQVPDVSATIRVRSVVGSFLEHQRIFHFRNGGDDLVYLGSADWMQRNLRRRVEAVFPVEDPRLAERVLGVLDLYFQDDVKARELGADGCYRRPRRSSGREPVDAQQRRMDRTA